MKQIGGGKRDRTVDLLHAMQALSQLSYTPDFGLGNNLQKPHRVVKSEDS